MLVGRDKERGQLVKEAMAGRGLTADLIAGDVTVPDDVSRILDALEVTDEGWRHVMDVNLDAVWQCARTFGRHFVDQRSGSSSTSAPCPGSS